MALLPTRRRGRSELTRLHDEMDDLVRSFFGEWEPPFFERTRWPAVDVEDKENEVIVRAEVAGCRPEDIDISVHGNTLTISGEKKQDQEKEEKGYYRSERYYGTFRRDLMLPSDVEAENIDATCKEGILIVKLPKAEKAKPVRIKVKGQ